MLKYFIRIIFLLTASLMATHALSQDLSGWSDKTVCRLVSGQQDDPQYLQEAKKRELRCSSNVTKTQNSTVTKVGSSNDNAPPSKTYNITIINKSRFPTKLLQRWSDSASAEMASRESDVLVFLYEVGKVISPAQEFGRGGHRLHQVLMSAKETNESKNIIRDWYENSSCREVDRHQLNELIEGLEKGVDWSRQAALCTEKRFIIMGLTDDMRQMPNHIEDIQEFFQHELYHSFQHDLENEGECRNRAERSKSNSKWMVEGGARYFSKSMLTGSADTYSISNNIDSLILKELYEQRMGNEALDGESDKVGSAALLLMTKRGLIKESEILDGSLFHDCARELKFDKNSAELKFILENWNKITKLNNGEYNFLPEALRQIN